MAVLNKFFTMNAHKSKVAPKNTKPVKTAPKQKSSKEKLACKAKTLKEKPCVKEETPIVSLPTPPKEPVLGNVKVIYNHYNHTFPISDGILDANLVDDKYCFSFVYKGNFQLNLYNAQDQLMAQPIRFKFQGLLDGESYRVEVIPDPEEEQKRPYKSGGIQFNKSPLQKKTGADLITEELKKMTVEELMEKGDKYKELIEQRELESCLYN